MDSTNKLTEIKKRLYAQNPKRINHIEGVAECAMELKDRHFPAIPDVKILQAAYMHDFTKEYPEAEHLKILEKYCISLQGYDRYAPKLLHSKSAYALAKFEFALEEDVCDAILYHTTGRENMSPIEKILYLADYIEKNRTHIPCVDLRDTYYMLVERKHQNPLDTAILYALDLTVSELVEKKGIIDFNTIEARNYLIKEGI
ncbi:MAG: HD domain-containing protein [Clostridiales bacterium]|jgi:predicted HD superfamily hydrolase involved in NAD metabolism|nr:HD domain-containing protein [Clostridiales bacterium]